MTKEEVIQRALDALRAVCGPELVTPPVEPPAGLVAKQQADTEPPFDPAAWGEDFEKWAISNCVFRDRCFGGIAALHTHFCEWLAAHDSVPVRRAGFEALLKREGFLFADGMVYGLLLKEDWESAHANPEPSPVVAELEPQQPDADTEAERRASGVRATAWTWNRRLAGEVR